MAVSVVYCNVVMNLDDLSVRLLFLTCHSFLLGKLGTFALIKLLYLLK